LTTQRSQATDGVNKAHFRQRTANDCSDWWLGP